MTKALITGISGFAGSHLAEHLLKSAVAVFGFFHPRHPTENINQIKSEIKLEACDLLDAKNVSKIVKMINPDYVFHLAAFSSPSESFKDPYNTFKNNVIGELNLLQALVLLKSKAKILIIGSADEYGNIDKKNLPADESTPLAPISPYAVSKVTQDMLGLQFYLHHKLAIVRVRPFNHIGPRQSTAFVVPAFAAQIAALEKKGGGEIHVGNLENKRDFTDVRDMVRAYLLALQKGIPGEVYNIGSGKAVKIGDILNSMIKLSSAKIAIQIDKFRIHTQDIETIYCDFSKFRKQTGWQPKIPLSKTLSDTIEYERTKLKSEI